MFCFLLSSFASAEAEDQAQCLSAYEEGQRSRRDGEFGQARQAFSFCGGTTCPAALHGDCLRWLDEVEAATPTVVFRSFNPDGEAISGVKFQVDSGELRELDGRAADVDPGEHTVAFELEGYQRLEQRITFSEGEKLRTQDVVMIPLRMPEGLNPEPTDSLELELQPSTRTWIPVWIGLGVAVVGGSGFAAFGSAARSNDRALESCFPSCPSAQVDKVKQQYLLANISLGVGGAGLLGAAAWWLLGRDDSESGAGSASLRVYPGEVTWLVGNF